MRTRKTRLTGMMIGTILATGCGTDFTGNPEVPIASPDVNVEVNVEGPTIDMDQETTVSQHADQETAVDQTVSQRVGDDELVVICHIPPGNPNNPRTITIGESALLAHLRHGDTLGPCDPCNDCHDDGVYCNGVESCEDEECVSIGDPCTDSSYPVCDEENDICVECLDETDCDDDDPCTDDTCDADHNCVYTQVDCDLTITYTDQVDTGGVVSGIALSPDESKLYVAYWEDGNSSRVQEFSLPDLALLQTFTFGNYHTHGDVVVSGDGTRIFTTNYYYSSISQIDLANGKARTDLSTCGT